MNQAQIQKMMKEAQKLQAGMQKAQGDLEAKEYTASAGGAVEVVMYGTKVIKSLDIKEDVIDPEDKEMLQDMILTAINACVKQVDEDAQQTMGAFTQGLPF